ncbi:MAG: SDR family oxidoreductase [Bacteroidia bacterium]|jgi:NAD(P)-dependent dehydrogenase (short-subunit alcohol dehydrogenase family)|nr:SDR family oxidoreductase [Bacteroidia bacterium]
MNKKTIAITGSQSGMGLAFRNSLEELGNTVIGIDLPGKGAEVEGDLTQHDERMHVVGLVKEQCNGSLDGIIANAGIDNTNVPLVFQLNYFGVIELLQGLQEVLAANGNSRVVITASNSVVITPGIPELPANELLNNNIDAAIAALGEAHHMAYQVSKLAVLRWMRNKAHTHEWAGSGITMNAVSPGAVLTPLLEKDLADPHKGPFIRKLPQPLGSFAKPNDITGLVTFMVSDAAKFIIGQNIIIDGGMESAWRQKDSPALWNIAQDDFMNLIMK